MQQQLPRDDRGERVLGAIFVALAVLTVTVVLLALGIGFWAVVELGQWVTSK